MISIDLVYSVSIICDKYELLNKMNQLMHDKFKAINCYIAPNKHFMPMVMEDITDESEYNIDDRRYYTQTYNIRLKAYIIKQSDFKVTKVPSRMKVSLLNIREDLKRPKIEITEEDYNPYDICKPYEESPYKNKKIIINIDFDDCFKIADFTLDTDFVLLDIETNNVYDFILRVNDEIQDLEYEVKMYDGDDVNIEIERDDPYTMSTITFVGYDPNVVYDERWNPESSLDDDRVTEEIIDYKREE